ncbi:hypothetical protein SAMN04489742_4709 [Arthrobacter crystallopoietes]|uniref:Transposase n=1 Tax=Crystallibacter crystallopoietes TaxID=37928 RepID=A0A1H1HVU6_9MICC|nr:hypothetical protein SAMN04489742_4709 [Arthrobacter crystallopoietes]
MNAGVLVMRLAGLAGKRIVRWCGRLLRSGPVVAALRRARTSCVYDDAPIEVKLNIAV